MSKIPKHAEKIFTGILHDVYQWQQEQFDGSFRTFEGLKRRDAVSVLAVTKDNKIIINYEEQPGVGDFISVPAGDSESMDLLSDAKRELEEETGYTSDTWKHWFTSDILYYEKMDWNNNFFIASGCVQSGNKKPEVGEKIENRLVTFEEFIDITQLPKFRNGELKRRVFLILNSADKKDKLEEFKGEIFG